MVHRTRRTVAAVGMFAALLSVPGTVPVIGADSAPAGGPTAGTWDQAAQGSPGPSAPASFDPMMATLRLMNMPPAGIMETCRPSSASLDGLLAIVACSFGDDVVVYANLDDAASLTAAYQDIVASAAVEGGTSCKDGAFEGPYLGADGAPAGRVVCQTGSDGTIAAWTDDRNLVMGFLLLAGDGFAELHDHWLAVRLDAASPGDASPSPAGATPEPVPHGTEIRQWAAEATASSEYTSTDWSAAQAVGGPDAPGYGGHTTSWAPLLDPGQPEWLELTYAKSVVPTAIHIWEANGAGFVVRVEAWDEDPGIWVTLWQGTDPTPEQVIAFSPPLTRTDIATQRIRVTAGPGAAGYPYVDAVQLVGLTAEP